MITCNATNPTTMQESMDKKRRRLYVQDDAFNDHHELRTWNYKHCEYQAFDTTHVVPETQTVQPVQPFPPHWPQ
jgi:hypothetical protein